MAHERGARRPTDLPELRGLAGLRDADDLGEPITLEGVVSIDNRITIRGL